MSATNGGAEDISARNDGVCRR